MKILVLGNGFDIEHNLPTKYSYFLDFIENIKTTSSNDSRDKNIFRDYILRKEKKHIYNKIWELTYHNIWINYFQQRRKELGDNWIDFEREISEIIQAMEKSIIYIEKEMDANPKSNFVRLPQYLFDRFSAAINISDNQFKNASDIYKHKEKMLSDLNNLIRALEIYLYDFVEKEIEISVYNPDIFSIVPDKVLTFNYTNTYEKIYGKQNRFIEYDYIHGKVDENRDELNCNLVLGIDEYLKGKDRDENINFIEFKKYYQRIKKRTGNQYKDWIKEIKENINEYHEIVIFGHSLDITDKDILLDLLDNENVKVTIYYHDETAHSSQIAHLVSILGQENVIRRVYGKDATIVFKPQSRKEYIRNSSFEITQDIGKLKYLFEMSNKEAEALIEKICCNIENNRISYFANQEKIIYVYNELQAINLDGKYRTILLAMAKIIAEEDKSEIQITHSTSKWDYYDLHGCHDCSEKTKKFITEINKYNEKVYKNKLIIVEDLENKVESLENINMISGEISENTYYDIFLEATKQMEGKRHVEELWQKLIQLLDKVNCYQLKQVLLDKVKGESSPVLIARMNYLIDRISERIYEEEQIYRIVDE